MISKYLISIIIPTFNRAHLIAETLDSVLAQTYTNWECIVVDDGSTDSTHKILEDYCKKDQRFQYHYRPKNRLKGGNAARNYGFEISKGDYINWLDSDDILDANKLEIQLDTLLKNNKKVCVSNGQFFFETPNDRPLDLWSEKFIKKDIIDDLISQHNRWQTGTVLWSRKVVILQNWNEELKGGQEWLYHILMAIKIPFSDFCFINDSLLFIRNSNKSITREVSKINRFNNYLKSRILLLNELQINNKNLFLKYYRITYMICMKYVKYLITKNSFKKVFEFSKIIAKVSLNQLCKFYFGIVVYKIFSKDYFLKRVIKE